MRYLAIELLLREMGKIAPPAWCKLALLGAVHTGKVSLYARSGKVRAFLPPYALHGDGSPLPPLLKWKPWTQKDLIERYGLGDVAIPNESDIEVWDDEWIDEPRRIALGWTEASRVFRRLLSVRRSYDDDKEQVFA